eukprot:CAMPEP_0117497940 /NCGR_PEP_ID=MMETSP0784-20121206/21449_1 /TAXON_ID=39447 /ORGANISM="" /LENGTH=699 /DNA_ID=CAMNT_0005292993 /DNA_START=41 /DNA_END=2140 /DNA_ORIENTATION=+
MWWGRRDAFARITAAALWPSRSEDAEEAGKKAALGGCTFLLADDGSLLQMQPQLTTRLVPTERNLVRCWRRAITGSQEPGASCESQPWRKMQAMSSEANESQLADLGKRELLSFLQTRCSLEFLRTKGLNKSIPCLLKSTTRDQLLDVWKAYRSSEKSMRNGAAQCQVDGGSGSGRLCGAIKLAFSKCPPNSVVILLHETEAVPLRLFESGSGFGAKAPSAVVFCLGAVRDMTEEEVKLVGQIAAELQLHIVRCCVGRVPEFSSKVVRCLSAAHRNELLFPAVESALKERAQITGDEGKSSLDEKLLVSAVALLSFGSDKLSAELSVRSQMLELVQICVCTLWRSRAGDALMEDVAVEDLAQYISDNGGKLQTSKLEDFLNQHPEHRRVLKITSRLRKERVLRQFCQAHSQYFKFNGDDGPGNSSVEVLKAGSGGSRLHLVFTDGAIISVGTRFVAGLVRQGHAAPTEKQVLDALLHQEVNHAFASQTGGRQGALRHAISQHSAATTVAVLKADSTIDSLPLSRAVLHGSKNPAPFDAAAELWPQEVLAILDCKGFSNAARTKDDSNLVALARQCCAQQDVPLMCVHSAENSPASFVTLLQFMQYSGCLRNMVRRSTDTRTCKISKRALHSDSGPLLKAPELHDGETFGGLAPKKRKRATKRALHSDSGPPLKVPKLHDGETFGGPSPRKRKRAKKRRD